MYETLRDSVVGHCIRWITKGKVLSHYEDRDPNCWRMYISVEKSEQHSSSGALQQLGGIELKRLQGPSQPEQQTHPLAVDQEPSEAGTKRWTLELQREHQAARPDHNKQTSAKQRDLPLAELENRWSAYLNSNYNSKRSTMQSARSSTRLLTKESNKTEPTLPENETGPSTPNNGTEPTSPENETEPSLPENETAPTSPGNETEPSSPENETAPTSAESDTSPAPPEKELERQWVTAAIGQEGMDVSMEKGNVDDNLALVMTAQGTETAWNAIQLEAGYPEEPQGPQEPETIPVPKDKMVRNIVVWYSNMDEENPLNWSYLKKAFVTSQIYLLTVCTYIGTSIFSPGGHNVQTHFGVGEVSATLCTSLAILGYGIGVMFWSPLSEAIRIGRKPVYISSLLIFILLQISTALAVNFKMLLAFRFLTGLAGAPVLAIGGASINDMYLPAERGFAIVMWVVVSIAAPVLGPLVGGFAAQANGWRWTVWTLMWFASVVWILLLFVMPETNQANILYRRSRRLRVLTGDKTIRSEHDVLSGQMTVKKSMETLFARPFVLAFTEPILLFINCYIGLLSGILFSSLNSFPLVFEGIYDFNLGLTGLSYIGLLVGSVLAAPPMYWYIRFRLAPQVNEAGQILPEKRLGPAIIGSFLVPISLILFGWTAREEIHWIVPIIASSFFGIAIVLLTYAVLNYLPDAYPAHAASVLAGNELCRSTASAIFPLFATQMYRGLGIGVASTVMAGVSILFIPVSFALYHKGHVLRHKSKRAQHQF